MNPGTATKVSVKSYTRANGTVVASYTRGAPPGGTAAADGAKKAADAAKKLAQKAAEKAKAILDAIDKFNSSKKLVHELSEEIADAIYDKKPVSEALINKLSKAYDDAFKAADEAMKILPAADKIKLKTHLIDLAEDAAYSAEIGASKFGTSAYKPSNKLPAEGIKAGKAKAAAKFAQSWSTRSGELLKAINASKDATGTVSSQLLANRLNQLKSKPGLAGIATALSDSEIKALNARGITISGSKFTAANFTDPTARKLMKTLNSMDKAGNPIIRQSASDLAKVGVTQSKNGVWTITKTGLKTAGKMLPVAAGVLEAADRLDNGKDVGEATRGAIITTIASIAGSAAGGAVAGSVIPGAGTLGGFIFGLVGGIGGAIAGGWGSDRIDEANKPRRR